MRTPSLSSSRIGASAACAVSAATAQLLDEAAERDAAADLVLPRQLRDVEHVGERLLAAGPQREPDVRARRAEQLVQHAGRPAPFACVAAVGEDVVAVAMQPLQQPQRVGDRPQMLDLGAACRRRRSPGTR